MASSRVSSEDRREQLIEATISVMREDGVSAITLRNIAKRAGAPLATVHYCFDNKEDLIHAAVVRWLATMVGYATTIPSTEGFRATVDRFAQSYWDQFELAPDDVSAQLELVLWAARHENFESLRPRIYTGYEDELAGIFEASFRAEQPEGNFDARGFVRLLLAIFDGCSMQYLLQPDLLIHRDHFFFLVRSVANSVLSGDLQSQESLAVENV